jgi:hypothetical protein
VSSRLLSRIIQPASLIDIFQILDVSKEMESIESANLLRNAEQIFVEHRNFFAKRASNAFGGTRWLK